MGQQLYSRSNPVPVQPYPGLPYPGQEPNPGQQLYRSYSVQPNHTQSCVEQHNLVRQISDPGQPYPGVPGQPLVGHHEGSFNDCITDYSSATLLL